MRYTSILHYASDCDWLGRSQVESVGHLVGLGYPCLHGIHTKKTRNSCADRAEHIATVRLVPYRDAQSWRGISPRWMA